MDSVVTVDWLSEHLDDPDLVVLDCTNFAEWSEPDKRFITVSGASDWARAHIERSCHADFARGFCGDTARFRNTLPAPYDFAAVLSKLGISNDSRVVLYDNTQSMWAARVWWMLRWIGFDNAAILDGGLQNWVAEGRCVSSVPSQIKPSHLECDIRPALFVTKDEVQAALVDGGALLIDALSEAQFAGRESDLGLMGHIPGAVNVPGANMIDPISGKFLPLEELTALFPDDRSSRCIVYCGSGIAAASVAFVMNRLGFDDVSIYMPGLQEWIEDPNAPVA